MMGVTEALGICVRSGGANQGRGGYRVVEPRLRDCMRERALILMIPATPTSPLFCLIILAFSLSRTTLRPTSVVCRLVIHSRLVAGLFCEEVLDPKPIHPPPSHLQRFGPQDFLLSLPAGSVLEEALPGLDPVRAPLALGCGPVLGPLEVLGSETVTCLRLVESLRQSLVGPLPVQPHFILAMFLARRSSPRLPGSPRITTSRVLASASMGVM